MKDTAIVCDVVVRSIRCSVGFTVCFSVDGKALLAVCWNSMTESCSQRGN